MTEKPRAERLWIEPFDGSIHDREAFSCGIDAVDNFLKRTANKLSKADNLRLYVMTNDGANVTGFYAVNAATIDYADLPPRFARTRPGHGSIPTAYLSMMGVDRRFSGRGLGRDLLANALMRVLAVSDELGIAVVLLDVLDCGNPAWVARRHRFYGDFGFQPLPGQPRKLFLTMSTVRASRPGDSGT